MTVPPDDSLDVEEIGRYLQTVCALNETAQSKIERLDSMFVFNGLAAEWLRMAKDTTRPAVDRARVARFLLRLLSGGDGSCATPRPGVILDNPRRR